MVHVFKNWKLLFKNFCGNTYGWKNVWKYTKCCLKTENCCLEILTKQLLRVITPYFLFISWLSGFSEQWFVSLHNSFKNRKLLRIKVTCEPLLNHCIACDSIIHLFNPIHYALRYPLSIIYIHTLVSSHALCVYHETWIYIFTELSLNFLLVKNKIYRYFWTT